MEMFIKKHCLTTTIPLTDNSKTSEAYSSARARL